MPKFIAVTKCSVKNQATQGDPINVSTSNAMKPLLCILEKFDGIRSKFHNFIQQIKLFLILHPSWYSNDNTQVGFVGTLLSGVALS